MSRNRIIKVDFWADEKIGKLSHVARLLFVGSWNFADDSGVCRGNPAYLRNNIFPYDSVTLDEVNSALQECLCLGLLQMLEASGERFFQIKNFLKHQSINRPSRFRYVENSSENTAFFNDDSVSCQGVVNEQSLTKVKEKEKVKVNICRKSGDVPTACYEILELITAFCTKHKRTYSGSKEKAAKVIKAMHTIDGVNYAEIKEAFERYAAFYTGAQYEPEIFSARALREKWNSLKGFLARQDSKPMKAARPTGVVV